MAGVSEEGWESGSSKDGTVSCKDIKLNKPAGDDTPDSYQDIYTPVFTNINEWKNTLGSKTSRLNY